MSAATCRINTITASSAPPVSSSLCVTPAPVSFPVFLPFCSAYIPRCNAVLLACGLSAQDGKQAVAVPSCQVLSAVQAQQAGRNCPRRFPHRHNCLMKQAEAKPQAQAMLLRALSRAFRQHRNMRLFAVFDKLVTEPANFQRQLF